MAKFYTCRAVVNPLSGVPSVRLCLKPTTDGLNCGPHAGVGHGVVGQKSAADPVIPVTAAIPAADQAPEKANEGAKAPGVTKAHAPACRRCEREVEMNEKGYCVECAPKAKFWPTRDDGSPLTSEDYGHAPRS